MAVAVRDRQDAIKKQFGAIVEQPRLTVIDVGPDVKQYVIGDEVMIHRKAVAYNATAVNITGFGAFVLCQESEVVAKIERLPEAEALALYKQYARLKAEQDEGARGQIITDPNEPPPEIAGLPELPDEPLLVKP